MRYELSDCEWSVIKPMLPNKPRGIPRVDDRRVLNGIFWALPSGAPWRDLPEIYGPRTTCYNRFVRWREAGVWDQIMAALSAAHDVAEGRGVEPHRRAQRAVRGADGGWQPRRLRSLRPVRSLPAVIEAKMASINPVEAEGHAVAYAEQLAVPFVFLSNGRPPLEEIH